MSPDNLIPKEVNLYSVAMVSVDEYVHLYFQKWQSVQNKSWDKWKYLQYIYQDVRKNVISFLISIFADASSFIYNI